MAEFEKKCLTSDVNLAEVASVHQILSLLGQKVQVPPKARTRMYQLVKGRETVAPQRFAEAAPAGAGAGHKADSALDRAGTAETSLARAIRTRRGLYPPDSWSAFRPGRASRTPRPSSPQCLRSW